MTTGLTALIASMDDERGLTISVHRDCNAIRIDVAGTEILLSQDAATAFRHLLHDAQLEAMLWELNQ